MNQDDDTETTADEPEEIDFREYDLYGNYLGPITATVPLFRTDDDLKAAYERWDIPRENIPDQS